MGWRAGVSESVWALVFGLEDLAFESDEGEDILSPKGSRPAQEPNQPRIQWLPAFPGSNAAGA